MSHEQIPENGEAPARFSRTKLSLASAALIVCGLLMMLAGTAHTNGSSLRATATSLFAEHPAVPAPAPAVSQKSAAEKPTVDWLTPMPTRPQPTTPVPTTHYPTVCKKTSKTPDNCMG